MKNKSPFSHSFKQQLQIGAALANQLDKVTPVKEICDFFGISDTMVRRIECQALYKVATRLREALIAGKIEKPVMEQVRIESQILAAERSSWMVPADPRVGFTGDRFVAVR